MQATVAEAVKVQLERLATAAVSGHVPDAETSRWDADEWRLYLRTQGLAENTIRRRSGITKQFFNAAMRKWVIDSNPFADLVATVKGNASRFYFVSREEADKEQEACPDAQWRLLFALARYGGLRCPSEHLTLRWGEQLQQRAQRA